MPFLQHIRQSTPRRPVWPSLRAPRPGCTHPPIKRMDGPRDQQAHQQRGGRAGDTANPERPSEAYGAIIRRPKNVAAASTETSAPRFRRRGKAKIGRATADHRANHRAPRVLRQAVAWRARGRPAPALFFRFRQGLPGRGLSRGRTRLLLRGVVSRLGCRGACRVEPSVDGNS